MMSARELSAMLSAGLDDTRYKYERAHAAWEQSRAEMGAHREVTDQLRQDADRLRLAIAVLDGKGTLQYSVGELSGVILHADEIAGLP